MSTSNAVDFIIDGQHAGDLTTAGLSQWLRENGIWLHPNLTIQPLDGLLDEESPERGASAAGQTSRPLGVFLSPHSSPLPIPSGTPIGLIPKTACLSPRTSALRPYLARLDIDPVFGPQATSGLLLSFCLLYEKHLEEGSAFNGYIQSLPRERPGGQLGICLPLEQGEDARLSNTFTPWTETARLLERAELRARDPGTSPGWPSHSSDATSLSLLQNFYHQVVLPFFTVLDPGTGEALSRDLWSDFLGSYSLVSSRAFVCDTYHGLALVPLADIFNHAEPAEEGKEDVEIQQHVQFECEDLVCTRCGALTDSETGRCRKRCKHSKQKKPSLCEMEGSDDDDDDENLIYMTTIVPLYASSTRPLEIFNNYGPLSPARLFTSYGFVADTGPNNRWERYCWDWRSSVERAEVLGALGLSKEEEGQALSRKRSHEDSKSGDNSTKTDEDSAARHRWLLLVSTLSASAADGMDALFPSPDSTHTMDGRERDPLPAPTSGSRLLPLPKQSPFALMDIASGRDNSEVFVSPSQDETEHTADEVRPLFVDGRGRVSRPLWTICVLAALIRHTLCSSKAEWSKEQLLQLLESVEERAEARLAERSESRETVQSVPRTEEHAARCLQSRILSSAASMLQALVQARLGAIAAAAPAARVEATTAREDSVRSCAVRLAHKEHLVLLNTLKKMEALDFQESGSSRQLDGQHRFVFKTGNAE